MLCEFRRPILRERHHPTQAGQRTIMAMKASFFRLIIPPCNPISKISTRHSWRQYSDYGPALACASHFRRLSRNAMAPIGKDAERNHGPNKPILT
jgi:hypothetical protein